MEESICITRLLTDSPSADDKFGGHEKVANAIASLVRDEPGGRAIALEGTWGSGKSTIVKILSGLLDADADTRVWIFDAWAHKGDPLRRSFLERLVDELRHGDPDHTEWVSSAWDDKKEELAKRMKTEDTTSTPQLTLIGALMAVFFFMAPVGTALIASGISGRDWEFALPGLAILLMPLAFLAVIFIKILAAKGSPSAKEFRSAFALLSNESTTTTRSQTVETPDPTSVEFYDLFEELMTDALTGSRRLLLVLDNLDRVEPDEALSIWSSMQTFLHPGEHTNAEWFKKLWVLVPYDREGITKVWDGGEGSTTPSFLGKSFQIRFNTPPTVLSDWRKYMLAQLNEAFPDHDKTEFDGVYNLLESNSEDGKPPTPRDIKLFVNHIGALHRQWQDEYSLSNLAVYVSLVNSDTDIIGGLKDGTLPGEGLRYLLGQESPGILAALVFNAPLLQAQQLLLGDDIRSALAQATPNSLLELEGRHGDGFWVTIESLARSKLLGWNSVTRLTTAAACLDQSNLLRASPQSANIKASMRRAALEFDDWRPFDDKVAQGLIAMCRLLTPDESLLAALRQGLSATSVRGEDQTEGATPATWATGVITFLEGLLAMELLASLKGPITIQADAESTIEVCGTVVENDPGGELWGHVLPQTTLQELTRALASAASSGQFAGKHARTVKFVVSRSDGVEWKS